MRTRVLFGQACSGVAPSCSKTAVLNRSLDTAISEAVTEHARSGERARSRARSTRRRPVMRAETLVSVSVVRWRVVPASGAHVWPGVRFERMDQPCAKILGVPELFRQTGREGLEPDESFIAHRSGMGHGRTPC